MIPPLRTARRAFTLIELLVVISILAILMTLLFPAVTGALDNAKKAQAKNAATQLATALVAYNTEYGRFPDVVSGGGNANSAQLMNILTGQDETNNPRKIVFLEVPRAKNGGNGAVSSGTTFSSGYLDPWKKEFEIRIDDDYNNEVEGPNGDTIRKTVVVWSTGKDGRVDPTGAGKKDDVKSWE